MSTNSSSTTKAKPRETAILTDAGSNPVPAFDPALHWHETLRDGTRVLIRPIRKEDADLERAFIERLSPLSRGYRFLGQMRVNDDMIRRLTDIDYQRDMAFVALRHDSGQKVEIGVSRFCTGEDGTNCECAGVVSDEWQGRGLGHLLMRHLIEVARQRGIKRMYSIDSVGNQEMRKLAEDLGFERKVDRDNPKEVLYSLDL